MFTGQQRVGLERSSAAIGQVVAGGTGTDDHELSRPTVGQFVRSAIQTISVLLQQLFNGFGRQSRVIRRQTPINVEKSISIDRDDALDTVPAWQQNLSVLQIDIGPI